MKNLFKVLSQRKKDPPTLSTTPQPVGWETLFEGAAPIMADIIFVHGLCGHPTKTWTKDDVCWPKEFLSKEEALSHIRVLTFGYDANVVNFGGRASLNSLFEHSIDLLNGLSRERKQDAQDRPIIFVAHSLGGLIVKDALNHSASIQDTNPRLARIFSATRGIIFFGTPHRGSGMTSLAKVVASVAQVAFQSTNVNLIRDLERNAQTLDRVREGFSRILDKRTLTVWSFVEARAVKGGSKVVDGESAIIGDARENRETIHDDHIGMVKFSATSDDGYKKVLHAIELLLEGLHMDELPVAIQRNLEAAGPPSIEDFIEPLLQKKSMIVVGSHGVGKSTLAVHVLQHQRVVAHFEDRRYFVSCRLASSAEHLVEMISSILHIISNDNPLETMLQFFRDSPNSLLVLDGFETPWGGQDTQNIETLVKDILQSGTYVLATFWGKQMPGRIDWGHCLVLPMTNISSAMAAHREDGHVQYSPPLPFVHSPYFTGCENFLACLHARLQNGWATGSNCAEAISGLPGIGKTRIAIEYAIKLKNSYDLVYWCSAESRDALSGSYVKLAQLLELPESKEDHESAITAVVKWLSTSSVKWLLVLDNLDVEIPYELPTSSNTNLQPMQFFSGFLPQEFTGDILITTRAHILPGAIHTIQVPLMDIHNGTLFLLRRSGRIPKQGTLTTVLNSEDIKHAKDLVIETGGLPLALNQLGAWVQQTGSLVDCLEVFQTQKKRLLEKNVLQDCHPLSVIVVFEMCLKKAMDRLSYDNLHVSAQQFLWLLAFLHGDGILVSMLRDGVLYLNEPLKALIDNLYNLGVVVMVLDSYSLILRDEKELSIHRLVQHVIQDQIPDPIHWAELAVQIVSNVFPKVNYGTLDGPLPYLLHAEICVSNIKKHEIRIQEAGNLAFACGQYYYYAGLYQQAMQYYETALCILKENQRFVPTDNQHISVSFILCAKAQIFWRQGLYVQAIEFYQSALDTCQNQLGTEHYETAPILHQFARTLGEHGEYVKCEDMFGQALRIIKRKMGSEDKMTARTEHEFARILGEQQKFSQAEALSQHALEIFRKVEGICHPSTASVDRALCRIKFEQGKFDYCEETLWWCLDIMVKNMGPSHLETGTTFHELASLYYKQNRFTEAEKYYMESLAIYDKLCPGHPDTAETLYRLASLCQMEGKYEEATGYYAKVMEIRKAQLSAGHIRTLKAKQAYIALLQDMGQNEDAKQLEEASDSFDL